MTSPQAEVGAAVVQLVARLERQGSAAGGGAALAPHEALALQLNAQYPGGDVGVLSAFFLNLVRCPLAGPKPCMWPAPPAAGSACGCR